MATVHNNLTVGKTYAVTTAGGCTITDEDGNTVKVIAANSQGVFVAQTPSVTLSDDNALFTLVFNSALALDGNGGGGTITIDPAPTQGSDNAVSSGGVYTALHALPAPVPETLGTTTTLKQGHVYLVTADATAQDFTGITLADNATAEIWLTCTSDDNSVALPGSSEGWIWLDAMPDMEAGKTYAVAARNVGNAVLARPIYEYTTPAES